MKLKANLILILLVYFFSSPLLFAQKHNYKAKHLKAVLIIGPFDDPNSVIASTGDYSTEATIRQMDYIANLFIKNGVKVYKFYNEKSDWSRIVKVARDCNFFVYAGHGSNLGRNGNTGGLIVKSGPVSTHQLIKTLRLKKNALVVFKSVCKGAGSSAGDEKDIGPKVAERRVTYYASPFFKVGAAAYYANNYDGGVYSFLRDFLSGKTLKKAYHNNLYSNKIEFEKPFLSDRRKYISIASSEGGGKKTIVTVRYGKESRKTINNPKEYNIAYVGRKYFSIQEMH